MLLVNNLVHSWSVGFGVRLGQRPNVRLGQQRLGAVRMSMKVDHRVTPQHSQAWGLPG